jgi:hypothetical protein
MRIGKIANLHRIAGKGKNGAEAVVETSCQVGGAVG